jgi:chaperone required for assembly of F1-ATPase
MKGEMKDGVRLPSREDSLPKRFYKAADVAKTDAGWAVQLDGRGIRTPMKSALAVPTEALARLIAQEWAAQGERIDPATMPLTRLAHGAIDAASANREAVLAEVVKYAGTDLLRHRAAESALAERQAEAWDDHLRWAEEMLGARLPAVTGIMPAETSPQALDALKSRAAGYDNWRLTALMQATALTTSAVLGFALVEGVATADDIFEASRVDEDYQIAHWGEDAEAKKRAGYLRAECLAIGEMLGALKH